MSIVLQAEIVIPEGMGRAEALAKVCASLQTLIAERCRFWRTGRADVAVFGPQVENRPACTLYVYRVERDFREATGGGLRYKVWTRKAERVTR